MRRASLLLLALCWVVLPNLAAASPARVDLAAMWLAGDDLDATAGPADYGQPPQRDIKVQVWHDKDDEAIYERGEALSVHFTTNADLYVVVYRMDADGYVSILWPTSRFDDGFVYGGHTYSVPSPGSDQRLYASQSQGVEYVQAIASRYPFDLRELAIDFAFDRYAEVRYDYAVAGDPFLAVNDINFAITGLEEDVDFVVTDWAHLYIGSKVDYPRYTCNQCHTDSDGYRPYADSCTQVTVYRDYGWHNSWYVRFGWYPLYYEPPFYYWDYVSYRPYWYWYYPVSYCWPVYPVYHRPYPVYGWHTSPHYSGDHGVRYKRGVARNAPLYDVASPGTERRIRDDRTGRGATPASIARSADRGDGRSIGRTQPDQLVSNGAASRVRGNLDRVVSTERGRTNTTRAVRTGIRTDAPQRGRTIVAQRPPATVEGSAASGRTRVSTTTRNDEPRTSGARRWTRPVIRNVDRGSRDQVGGTSAGRTVQTRRPSTARDEGRTSTRVEPRTARGGSGDDRPQVRPQPRTTTRRESTSGSGQRVSPQRTRRETTSSSPRKVERSTRRETVKKSSDGKSGGGAPRASVAPSPRRTRSSSAPTVRKTPTVRKSSGSVSRGSSGSTTRKSSGTVSRSSSGRSGGAVSKGSGSRSGGAASRGSRQGGGSRGGGGGSSRGRGG